MKNKWFKIIIQTLIWLIFISTFIVSLGFTEKQRKLEPCQKIIVNILDSNQNHFLDSSDIIQFLKSKNYKILHYPLSTLPLDNIEKDINNLSVVKNAEVYTTIDGHLHIDIIQRTPILRIVNYNYESYYIDNEGVLFPLSDKYTARVLVANGNINEPYALFCNRKAQDAEKQDALKRSTILDDIFVIGKKIYQDSILHPLIEQIYINEEKEIELVPKIGDFIIVFGDTSQLNEKFIKLKAFYEKVLAKDSWDAFSKVNLMYNKQIVCTQKKYIYE
ncbi:MAG: cell division protein FtsQ/DivIB [Bacteroidales bacterium]